MFDSLLPEHKFHTVNVIDEYIGKALRTEIDTTLPAARIDKSALGPIMC